MPLVSATVSPASAKVSKQNDDAVLRCVGTTPTTAAATVSAWYRNSSDGELTELLQGDGSKYLVSNDTLTVFKVGE